MDDYGFLIFGAIAVVAVVLGIWRWMAERKRREAIQKLANRLGLVYRSRDSQLAHMFHFLDELQKGSNRYAFNILEGKFAEHPVQAFDYHYETHSTDSKGRRRTHHHYLCVFVLYQSNVFPELRIYPESFFSKLGQMVGFDDIDFESAEFSKAFTVRSQDKKFAYDICHTRMMEYLLQHRDLSIEIEGGCVATTFDRRMKPQEVEGRLQQIVEIRNLFPEYLYRA